MCVSVIGYVCAHMCVVVCVCGVWLCVRCVWFLCAVCVYVCAQMCVVVWGCGCVCMVCGYVCVGCVVMCVHIRGSLIFYIKFIHIGYE